MKNEIFRIVYCSRNAMADGGSTEDLEQILGASRKNNAQDGVTGALLYNQGIFAQTLEGPFEAVQTTYERIQADERHTELVLLEAETVENRLFAEWAMALATPDDPAGASAVLSRALAKHGDGSSEVLVMLDLLVRREPEWLAIA